MKVQLIHPPNDPINENIHNGYKSFPPPVGLEILVKYVEKFRDDIEFEIFDGNCIDIDEICDNLNAEVIGISDWFSNHENTINIASEYKKRNRESVIIVGGPNASNLGKNILENYPFIDYVVKGDGEEALRQIIEQKEDKNIPNLWYRDSDNKVKFTYCKKFNLNLSPPFNLEHIYKTDIQKYNSNLSTYDPSINLSPVPISSIRGCIKAITKGPCSFCSISSKLMISVLDPHKFWEQIRFLKKKYGIVKFLESGDSFIVGNYVERLLEVKPDDLDVHIRIYANLNTLNKNNISMLARIGVKEIFIGIESISKVVQERANKFIDKAKVYEVLTEIEKLDIHPFLSFVFGLPGESIETMNENYSFAVELASRFKKMNHISYNIGIPLVGSPWFKMLSENEFILKYYEKHTNKSLLNDDKPNYELLFLLSLKEYSEIPFYNLYKIFKKNIHPRLIDQVAGFGSIADNIIENNEFHSILNEFWER